MKVFDVVVSLICVGFLIFAFGQCINQCVEYQGATKHCAEARPFKCGGDWCVVCPNGEVEVVK